MTTTPIVITRAGDLLPHVASPHADPAKLREYTARVQREARRQYALVVTFVAAAFIVGITVGVLTWPLADGAFDKVSAVVLAVLTGGFVSMGAVPLAGWLSSRLWVTCRHIDADLLIETRYDWRNVTSAVADRSAFAGPAHLALWNALVADTTVRDLRNRMDAWKTLTVDHDTLNEASAKITALYAARDAAYQRACNLTGVPASDLRSLASLDARTYLATIETPNA